MALVHLASMIFALLIYIEQDMAFAVVEIILSVPEVFGKEMSPSCGFVSLPSLFRVFCVIHQFAPID